MGFWDFISNQITVVDIFSLITTIVIAVVESIRAQKDKERDEREKQRTQEEKLKEEQRKQEEKLKEEQQIREEQNKETEKKEFICKLTDLSNSISIVNENLSKRNDVVEKKLKNVYKEWSISRERFLEYVEGKEGGFENNVVSENELPMEFVALRDNYDSKQKEVIGIYGNEIQKIDNEIIEACQNINKKAQQLVIESAKLSYLLNYLQVQHLLRTEKAYYEAVESLNEFTAFYHSSIDKANMLSKRQIKEHAIATIESVQEVSEKENELLEVYENLKNHMYLYGLTFGVDVLEESKKDEKESPTNEIEVSNEQH